VKGKGHPRPGHEDPEGGGADVQLYSFINSVVNGVGG